MRKYQKVESYEPLEQEELDIVESELQSNKQQAVSQMDDSQRQRLSKQLQDNSEHL